MAHESLESLSLAVRLHICAFVSSNGVLSLSDVHRTHSPLSGLAHRTRGSLQAYL